MAAPAVTDRDDRMPRWQRVYLVALSAVTSGALTYALCDWGHWTRLHFGPYDGAWFWQAGPTASIPINYFGTILWGLGGAAVGALLALVGIAAWRRPVPRSFRQLGTAWSLTACLLTGTYYLWHLWPF